MMKNSLKHSIISLPLLVCFAFLIVIVSCKKEQLIEKQDEPSQEIATPTKKTNENCLSIAAYTNEIENNSANDLLITDIEYTPDYYVIHYATGESIPVCKDSIFCWQFNPDWQVDFQFMDSSMTNAVFWADSFQVDIQTELNPSGYAPLTAILDLQSELNCSIDVLVVGQNGSYSDVSKSFEEVSMDHTLPILGLYDDFQNTIITTCTSNGFVIASDTTMLVTDPMEITLPEIYVDVNDVSQMEPGFQLVSHLNLNGPNKPFMFDPYGDVRWYLDYRQHPDLNNLFYDVGIERLQNGNYYFGDIASTAIYEIDVFGTVINSWDLPGYGYHHNVYEKPDGNFLVTCEVSGSDHLDGGFTQQDRIIELDRTSGTVVKEWDLRFILDETRSVHVNFQNDWVKDWAHINAVIYDASDNTIIFSSRSQAAVVKVDYNDNIQWILANHTAWGENRQGQQLDQFLLTAVDQTNDPYGPMMQAGNVNTEEFEWNWMQHAIKKISDTKYILFDNGDNRNFGGTPNYSRAVIFEINETDMTVRQDWAFGRELGEEGFARFCSDADYLPQSDHVVFSPGYNVQNNNGMGAKIIEIDYNTNEVVFSVRLNSNIITLHRSERLTIYP